MKYLFISFLAALFLFGNSGASAQFNRKKKIVDPIKFQKELIPISPLYKSVGFKKAIAVPVLLAAVGLYSLTDNDLLNKYDVQEERNEWASKFHHRADDYLQYAPIAAVYSLNLIGIKGKNDFANRTAILIKSELIVGILSYSLKKVTAVPRPDTGRPTSFPSGHTAQAFAAAAFMAKEYGHKSIWYSIGAYTVATGIGAMRVMNNRHWVSDVLMGAGVGIFSTNFAYLTHQYKWGSKRKTGRTLVLPAFDGKTGMVSIIHNFN